MKKTIMVLIVLGLLCSYNLSFGDIYKYKDKDGVIHLTSSPEGGGDKVLIMKEKRILSDIKWELLNDNWYYDKKNITRISNIASGWTLHIINDDERESSGIPINKNINRLVSLIDVDCNNRMIRTAKVIGYDTYGNVIDVYEDNKWDYISPESFSEIIFIKFCLTKNKNVKKKKR